MSNYRIITNGSKFRIQERFLFVFWFDVTYTSINLYWTSKEYYEFDSYREALEKINEWSWRVMP